MDELSPADMTDVNMHQRKRQRTTDEPHHLQGRLAVRAGQQPGHKPTKQVHLQNKRVKGVARVAPSARSKRQMAPRTIRSGMPEVSHVPIPDLSSKVEERTEFTANGQSGISVYDALVELSDLAVPGRSVRAMALDGREDRLFTQGGTRGCLQIFVSHQFSSGIALLDLLIECYVVARLSASTTWALHRLLCECREFGHEGCTGQAGMQEGSDVHTGLRSE